MASTKYVELAVNKNLLDPKFNGYKLSLRPINNASKQLTAEVDRAQPNLDQYSYIHTKLFTLHNYLFADPWDDSAVYFVDSEWKVQKGYSLSETDTDITSVWNVPINKRRKLGHFNFTLVFASDTIGLLSDGAGTLHIIDTEERSSKSTPQWRSLFSNEVLGDEISFVILDAKCESYDQKRVINCVLMTIEPNADNKTHDVVLNWIVFNESVDGSWGATELEVLRGKDLHYCAVEPGSNSIYIASDHAFKFVNEPNETNIEKKTSKLKLYSWQQTSEDITISLKIEQGCLKSDLKITTKPTRLSVQLKEKQLLDLELAQRSDSDLTTWEIKDDLLSVVIYKEESGLMWRDLVKSGDLSGEQIVNPSLVADIHSRLAHLCSDKEETGDASAPSISTQQLEECDIASSSTVLERLDRKTHDHTHIVGISTFQVLFKVQLDSKLAPAIVLRHDVDACIMQPLNCADDWSLKHEGTLHAFGYVQASKEQKKFVSCSPDMSYAVIAESNRHIFIYRQKRGVDEGCELRNRQSGDLVSDVAEQQLINLPPDDILGIFASNKILFVLKANRLFFFYV